MNIITGQMPLMGFTADAQAATQNSVVAGVPSDFMQQILNGQSADHASVNITPMLASEQNKMDFGVEENYTVVTAIEALAKFKLPEVMHTQDPASHPKELSQNKESVAEPTVVYLLHWLATGHLSYVASDLAASSFGQTKNISTFAAASNDDPGNGLLSTKKMGEVLFEGNKIGFKHFDSNAIDVDAAEYERQRKSADAAIFNEQISPYLKRRLIVSSQEDHTHIILRDYFLDDQDKVSELKGLLANIKQNISGIIRLTINGHHYGDINNY